MKVRHVVLLGIAVVIGLAAVIGAEVLARPYTYQGSLFEPPVKTDDFSLPDQFGETFQLSAQRGEVVLLFFGYTHCPDVCPVTLSEYRQVSDLLGERSEQVKFVFITVDPERDNRETLRDFLDNFGIPIEGLTAEQSALEPVWEAFGVYHEKVDVGSAAGYLVDHTARIYVINKQGELQLTFPFGTSSEAMAQDITHLLKEN
jgi:protein SCO1/2